MALLNSRLQGWLLTLSSIHKISLVQAYVKHASSLGLISVHTAALRHTFEINVCVFLTVVFYVDRHQHIAVLE